MDWRLELHNYTVSRYGCAALYFGRKFKFITEKPPKLDSVYVTDVQMNSVTALYLIVGVARHAVKNANVMCFKFYDSVKHRIAPSANTGEWYYIPCKYLMSTDVKILCMKLLPLYGAVIDATGLSLVDRHIVRKGVTGTVKSYNANDDVYGVDINARRENLPLDQLLKYLR